MSTFVNFNIIDEKFFLWFFFEIHRSSSIFSLEWNATFILFSVLIVSLSHLSSWVSILLTRISCTMTTLIWRFKFASSQIFFVHSSSLLRALRDFSLLTLSTMISSEWHRVVRMFLRDLCFASTSRVFLTISFDVIFCVIWIFFCSITLIVTFSSLFEESVEILLMSMIDLIIAISRRAIIAQMLFFFLCVFFFSAIFFNRVVIFFSFLIVDVDLSVERASSVHVTRAVLINWSRTFIIFFALSS